MGTIFEDGKKPQNNITISKGGAAERRINPDTGKTDRSFAQPNPNVPQREVDPKAHASAEEEVEALNKNSTKGHTYVEGDGDDDSE